MNKLEISPLAVILLCLNVVVSSGLNCSKGYELSGSIGLDAVLKSVGVKSISTKSLHQVTCPASHSCHRFDVSGKIVGVSATITAASCAPTKTCSSAKCDVVDAVIKILEVLNLKNQFVQGSCKSKCCSTDNCNGSLILSFNKWIVIFTTLLALATVGIH